MKSHHVLFLLAALALTGCRKPEASPVVSGTIEVDEVHVASRYGGRVEKLFARDGDSLTNGQVIAELEAAELRAMRARAVAEVDELVAGPRPQEKAAAKGDWQALVAEVDMAELDRKRGADLLKEKTISQSEYDRLASHALSIEKSAVAARSRYDLLVAGTRPERIAQAQARVAELDAQLREMRVVAPTNCVIEVLGVRVGDVVAPNREIATLLLTDHLWVRVYVPQPWLGLIQIRQKVRVQTDAFAGRDFTGEVEQIHRAAEFTPRNVQTPAERAKQVFAVKVRLPSEPLRAGMSADVYFSGVTNAAPSP